MSSTRRRYCLIPQTWTFADIEAACCLNSSHVHLTRAEVYAFEREGVIEWLYRPTRNCEKGIVRLNVRLTSLGLSIRVGEYLANAIRDRRLWAAVMFAEMKATPASRMA